MSESYIVISKHKRTGLQLQTVANLDSSEVVFNGKVFSPSPNRNMMVRISAIIVVSL